MFRTMRRKEKIMSEEETETILNKAEFGTLACIGENGYPYSVPLNYAYDNGKLYFHSAKEGHKIDNISFNGKVCFSAVGYYKVLPEKFDTEYDSVILFGKASRITEEAEKKRALMLLIEKYSSCYLAEGIEYIHKRASANSVYKIDIEHMTGKLGR